MAPIAAKRSRVPTMPPILAHGKPDSRLRPVAPLHLVADADAATTTVGTEAPCLIPYRVATHDK
jgi:hypothetical protein